MSRTLNEVPKEEIIEAVNALEPQAVEKLCELVRQDSLLGQENGAQALMAEHYGQLGLDVKRLSIDEAKVREHPACHPRLCHMTAEQMLLAYIVRKVKREGDH